MRIVWLVFLGLVAGLVGWAVWGGPPAAAPEPVAPMPAKAVAYVISNKATPRADSIVAFALRQLGTNYCYAGSTPETGFDCSGFVNYVFARHKVPVPHSTALLIDVGRPVPRTQARPGDIIVFTGTAQTATTPGHAGIVLSQPGEPLRFIHSSSARRESGVKISQVEGTDYERRFMQVRRVL
ncbi:C40 family peptidase [Hymenobacter endophyticus]|uniref:NlpC/P60 family protein n=1 Tax=Hymenobacter endophyticus TaxID=3076335 RepID=A0ABU3TFV1_9BACT|nr:NlpC/P60 family protein [Hymenobacter endophyticus]MDU0370220.1 NlpC/P60 family protein [Hymenobacter endophyticus]